MLLKLSVSFFYIGNISITVNSMNMSFSLKKLRCHQNGVFRNYKFVACKLKLKLNEKIKTEVKQSMYSPGQALRVPGGSVPIFKDNRQKKMIRFSAPHASQFFRQEYPW